jgi:glycosyltransferase involved in cell wall biosynthesis
MLVSCLCPTFNRIPQYTNLVEEAIESFLRQNYDHRELILCNDQPRQQLIFNHPKVKVINCPERFPTFARKIDFMISQAQGQYLCRWDDDDISLPHRLTYSMNMLMNRADNSRAKEWRCENHIYAPKGGFPVIDYSHGNTHLTAVWNRDLLPEINAGLYPWQWAGGEDQQFNKLLRLAGYTGTGQMLPDEDVFYIYRWGVGQHWSGPGGDLQAVYDRRGEDYVPPGVFQIFPRWYQDYGAMVPVAIANTDPVKRHRYGLKPTPQL